MIHNQNGWKRLYPPVCEGEEIVIEGVKWGRRDGWSVPFEGIEGISFSGFLNKPPMIMKLIIPTNK